MKTRLILEIRIKSLRREIRSFFRFHYTQFLFFFSYVKKFQKIVFPSRNDKNFYSINVVHFLIVSDLDKQVSIDIFVYQLLTFKTFKINSRKVSLNINQKNYNFFKSIGTILNRY